MLYEKEGKEEVEDKRKYTQKYSDSLHYYYYFFSFFFWEQ